MNNPLHFPLSTTHKDQVNFNFHPSQEKQPLTRKKATVNKINANEANRSSKKKINSARNDNNISITNQTLVKNQVNNQIHPQHHPQLSNAYATQTARVDSSLQQVSHAQNFCGLNKNLKNLQLKQVDKIKIALNQPLTTKNSSSTKNSSGAKATFFSRVNNLGGNNSKVSRNQDTSQPAPNSLMSKIPQLTCFNQTVIEELTDFKSEFSAKALANHQVASNSHINLDYSPRPVKLNLKIKSGSSKGYISKQQVSGKIPNTTNSGSNNHQQNNITRSGIQNSQLITHDTTYMIGCNHRTGNLIQNESMNMSNLNLTNEYSSLSPTSNGGINHQLNSSLLANQNSKDPINQRLFRKQNIFASPETGSLSNNIDNIVNGIGCQTTKSGGATNKSFNLKIKLKNESSYKKLKLSSTRKNNIQGMGPSILRSNTKDEILNQSNLSAPREAYNSNNKIDHSQMETSNIIDEKISDMSFSQNLNEIIGSLDEKSEFVKMKNELQEKDECIQELLRRIDQLDKKVNTHSQNRLPIDKDFQQQKSINIVNLAVKGQQKQMISPISKYAKVNNFVDENQSEKENMNILQNLDDNHDQREKLDKIQNVLNNLNVKMLRFGEQGKLVEEEIRRNLNCQSTNTLTTERSLAQLSEMMSIQDYQSCMESRMDTYTQPTERDSKDTQPKSKYQNHQPVGTSHSHGKNSSSFSKTQNIKDILMNMHIEDEETKVLIESATASLNVSVQINIDNESNIDKQTQNSLKKADKKQLIQAIEAQQKRSKINFNNKTGKLQNLQLGKISGMPNIFQVKSREKTPIAGAGSEKPFQIVLNQSNILKKKSEPRKEEKTPTQSGNNQISKEQSESLRMVQEQLGQYQKIIKDQRSELDKQRKMNEKLKKTLVINQKKMQLA
ncbi:UNKNOWN [Stylonychia lemnae]|uniref:Uncharacterized protein n=1 Tax=Stylonychia lemnae TaxID=5949 RepID=A0A078AH24_STYLE|nr:UNKNOWN [Stylonychia lemnae]|eukprot:CDW81575.1 UNKNOWN [Stylonychia lemnae]